MLKTYGPQISGILALWFFPNEEGGPETALLVNRNREVLAA